MLGAIDGVDDGIVDGFMDGWSDGSNDGTNEGPSDGTTDADGAHTRFTMTAPWSSVIKTMSRFGNMK